MTMKQPDDSSRRRFPKASGGLGLPIALSPGMIPKALAAPSLAERFAEVNGVRLHYLIGGQGNAVILVARLYPDLPYVEADHCGGFHIQPIRRDIRVPDSR